MTVRYSPENLVERRSFPLAELRASDDGDSRIVTGHAAVFDVLSHPIADFRETIAPGTFAESIKNDDIRALWNHDPSRVLGRNKSKTLKLSEDDRGLAFEMDVAETQVGNDALVSIRRGDVDEMSFGFITIEDEWTQEPDELATRRLVKVRLLDVSPVAFAAYPDTDVAVRELTAWKESQSSAQRSLASREREQRLAEAEL